jgi:ubiquinone/menaquinone biosynthesis C-methylase UbiE
MERLVKHLGFFRHFGDFQFKRWLDSHASEFLLEIGVGAGQWVLDFGCGSGTYTIPASKLVGRDGRVYALDIDKGALNTIDNKAKHEGLENIIRIDSLGRKDIPIESETLDHVLLIDVIQEITDKRDLFNEVYRLLKPTGMVTIYPMHITEEEVIKPSTAAGFTLKERKFDGRILILSRKNDS